MTPKVEFIDLKKQYARLREPVNARIQQVLDHGQYIMGPEVEELEIRLQEYTGSLHCITVASGTEALLIALMALNLKPGDEVITTPFTFIATAEVIVLLGAVPVFVDIEPDTCNIDWRLIEARITSRTRAIMPVGLYGQTADMDEINAIAARNGNIPVIEDAAQSFGASYKAARSCNLSTIGCTSFFPSKPLGCYGDGGAIFTNDDALATAMREIRVHGQKRRYHHTRVGVGGRMDTLQCAIVLAKLDSFDAELESRLALGRRYAELIREAAVPAQLLEVRPDRNCVWAQYTVFIKNRDAVQQKLQALGIPTAVHYPLALNRQPAYLHLGGADMTPLSDAAAGSVISLPMHPYLDEATQVRIVQALGDALSA